MPLSEILPQQPKIAERTTGEVMGESAEQMARRNEISRRRQDELAVRSHHRAAAAIASGPLRRRGRRRCETPDGSWVHADSLVRADTSVEKLAQAAPGVRQGRHGHRRQREPAHRRRRRGAADERGEGARARLHAARRVPLVGVLGRRSGRSAADGPGARDARRRSSARASSSPTSTSSTCTRRSPRRC